jgi:hypothetical protein
MQINPIQRDFPKIIVWFCKVKEISDYSENNSNRILSKFPLYEKPCLSKIQMQ